MQRYIVFFLGLVLVQRPHKLHWPQVLHDSNTVVVNSDVECACKLAWRQVTGVQFQFLMDAGKVVSLGCLEQKRHLQIKKNE
jgi:hypothetical protein